MYQLLSFLSKVDFLDKYYVPGIMVSKMNYATCPSEDSGEGRKESKTSQKCIHNERQQE